MISLYSFFSDAGGIIQVLVEEALKRLRLTNRHGQACLSDTVLTVLVRKRGNCDDVGTCLLGGGVTVDTEAEALGGL